MNNQFSETQKRAISHYTGPCLVLAGPGSGKTTVITQRTKALIEQRGVNPSNILVITFTKASAVEMQERFMKLMQEQKTTVSFGTFHAVFFKILKYAYNYSASNILREDVKYRMIKEIVEKQELEIDDINEFTSSIISEISTVKGDMISINHYYSSSCSDEIFRRIYEQYENRIRRNNVIDFDDMLLLCYELLKQRQDILSAWQKKYQFILIDEFQDINRIQYEIIKMLSKPEDNLFIVGDDDQSIYRFRGARPEIMLNFEKDYEQVKRVTLEENYRSTPQIVHMAQNLIRNNKKRFKKNIRAVREDGEAVQFLDFSTQMDENNKIVELIQQHIKIGGNYSDIAILFRTNIDPRFLVDKLMEYSIPFHMKDSMPSIYEHFIAKNIFSYIKIARGCNLRSEYLQIMNRPKRYISREALSDEQVSLLKLKQFYCNKRWMIERIEKLEYDLTIMAKMSPFAAVNYIRKGIGYDKFIEEYAAERKINVDELYNILEEITQASKPYDTMQEWFVHIDEYTKELEKQEKNNKYNKNAVELCTMHSSKGLEYDIVYVIDAVEGVTPHAKAMLEDDMEEERRMFYVALTRARNRLYVCTVKQRFSKPVSVSRFVGEMKINYAELKEQQRVMHKKYGYGIVKKIDGGKIIVYFPTIKKELVFDMKYAFSNQLLKIV